MIINMKVYKALNKVLDMFDNKEMEEDDIIKYSFSSDVLRISRSWFQNKEIEESDIVKLKDFFKEFTIDELADIYKYRIQDDLAKETLKEIIMERLELPDEDSFKLYIELS